MKLTARLIVVLLAAALCGGASDVKYTLDMQMMQGMPPMSSTVYVKGGLERRDMNMPMGMGTITTITQCGEKKTIVYNPKCKVYYQGGLDEHAPAMGAARRGASGPVKEGGVVKIDTTYTDTGEKQTIEGLPARHVTVRTVFEPQPGACMQSRGDMTMDMWMANLPGSAECKRDFERMPAQMAESSGCRDKYEFNVHGAGGGAAGMSQMGGMIVKGTMTMAGVNPQQRGGSVTMTLTSRDISTANIDPAVFQVPSDYKQASSMQEVYQCGMSIGGMMSAMRQSSQQQAAQAQQQAAQAQGAAGAAGGEGGSSKPAGVTRIGVVLTDKSSKVDVNTFAMALVQKIDGHQGFDAVKLDATEPDAAQKECVEKKCDFILYGDVQEAKTSMPKIGGLLRGAARMGGGSAAPTQSVKMDYRLTFASDNQQVAKDSLNNSQQAMDVMAATEGLVDKTADRAATDASKARR